MATPPCWLLDLIELEGEGLRRSSIEHRKRKLAKLVRGPHLGIVLNEYYEGDGEIVFKHACKLGCEGIVSKRLGSAYRSGRSPHWVKVKNPNAPSSKAESGGGLAVMATYKRRKFLNQGKRADPAPENKRTDPAPIRARAPLIEQFYVAVDRQLKSGFGTYEAAEKAAQEIKKRYPGPQVTVFDAKEHRHTVIEQPIASTKRRD